MSKATYSLIIILFCTILFFFINIINLQGQKHNTTKADITTPHTKNKTVAVTLIQNSKIKNDGKNISINITISNAPVETNMVQLELEYDPIILTITTIKPGTFFTNPKENLKIVNEHTGRISYALHCTPTCVNKQTNVVAQITAVSNNLATKQRTTISFLPKTLIRTTEEQEINITTKPLSFIIQEAIPPVISPTTGASNDQRIK
jgi:hypothetical protein